MTCLFSTYIGLQWGAFLGYKGYRLLKLGCSGVSRAAQKIGSCINVVINPTHLDQPSSTNIAAPRRSFVERSFTRLGQLVGAVAGGAAGYYLGNDSAIVVLRRSIDFIGRNETVPQLQREPIELNQTMVALSVLFWTTVVTSVLAAGAMGRLIGGDLGGQIGSELNKNTSFRRRLIGAASALQEGYSPETSRIVTKCTNLGKNLGAAIGAWIGLSAYWVSPISEFIDNKVDSLGLKEVENSSLLKIVSYFSANALSNAGKVFSIMLIVGCGIGIGEKTGGSIGKFTGTQLYRMYHVCHLVRACCSRRFAS